MKDVVIVRYVDSISDIIDFFVMIIMTVWTLFKYNKQSKDKIFVFSLCMYPFSYFLLMIGGIYFVSSNNQENKVYGFLSKNFLPLHNLVKWTIELLICFEMQLIRVKLNAENPA